MPVHRIHLKGPWEYDWLGPAPSAIVSPRTPADYARPDEAPPAEAPADAFAAHGRVHMPCDWETLFGPRPGRARFTRRFHRPTNLEAGDSVRLVFDGLGGTSEVTLNDAAITPVARPAVDSTAAPPALTFEITPLLQPANRLIVEVEFAPGRDAAARGGLWGPVALEIVSR